jgi:hypothetical protein
MTDDAADETSYRYNLNRLSPFHYLNTLKGKTLLLFFNFALPRLQDEPRCLKEAIAKPVHYTRQQARQVEETLKDQEKFLYYKLSQRRARITRQSRIPEVDRVRTIEYGTEIT